jgi:hypothetical protein
VNFATNEKKKGENDSHFVFGIAKLTKTWSPSEKKVKVVLELQKIKKRKLKKRTIH